jgi:hypothetical protein
LQLQWIIVWLSIQSVHQTTWTFLRGQIEMKPFGDGPRRGIAAQPTWQYQSPSDGNGNGNPWATHPAPTAKPQQPPCIHRSPRPPLIWRPFKPEFRFTDRPAVPVAAFACPFRLWEHAKHRDVGLSPN